MKAGQRQTTGRGHVAEFLKRCRLAGDLADRAEKRALPVTGENLPSGARQQFIKIAFMMVAVSCFPQRLPVVIFLWGPSFCIRPATEISGELGLAQR